MPSENETAFVLPKDAALGFGTPVHFPNFPGVWVPGEPVAVSELGFASLGDARAARDALAPALKEGRVPRGSAPMPPRPNHADAAGAAIVAPDPAERE